MCAIALGTLHLVKASHVSAVSTVYFRNVRRVIMSSNLRSSQLPGTVERDRLAGPDERSCLQDIIRGQPSYMERPHAACARSNEIAPRDRDSQRVSTTVAARALLFSLLFFSVPSSGRTLRGLPSAALLFSGGVR